MLEQYSNPLVTRYSTPDMSNLFSDKYKFKLWRKLWVALAESQKELGLEISNTQIDELKRYQDDINLSVALARESIVRHDVMAHIYAYSQQAKTAAPIIHLGATSCFVTDNADIITFDRALQMIKGKILGLMQILSKFAKEWKSLPTLAYTHLQSAQVTTVGKRASLWLYDLTQDFQKIEQHLNNTKLRGVKGATGTQASFYTLFDNNESKVLELDKLVARKMGYDKIMDVTGQTYSRKLDYELMTILSSIAQSAYKFASDLRLLQGFKELEEPFDSSQVGSSAMAYKRNPMRSERLCSLARFVFALPQSAAMTDTAQWLERTLDDSAIRRITIPQAFLALDGVLNLYLDISKGIIVNTKVIQHRLGVELPFMATETILMECVKAGGNRQTYHELIRKYSIQAVESMKNDPKPNDLIDRMKFDKAFDIIKDKWNQVLDSSRFIGLAPQQTENFINNVVQPLLDKERKNINEVSSIKV